MGEQTAAPHTLEYSSGPRSGMLRWRIAILVSLAIAINYLDRLLLPSTIDEIRRQSGLSFDKQDFALLNTAFLAAYGSMYLVGGRLMDFLGTRRGFALIMIFWSLACASHGFASGLILLAISRLLLGVGEGGGFPAATRAVAEWFPIKERSTAMGMINGGTGIGGVLALPYVALIVSQTGLFGSQSWRWVFFITGAVGIVWTFWWLWEYYTPEKHPRISPAEQTYIQQGIPAIQASHARIPMATLFQYKETWGIVSAKFLTDAAWYFILFWLPTYLRTERGLNMTGTMSLAWIPHAAAFVGCLVGGSLSSYLIHRKFSLNIARKLALFLSAAVLPVLIFVPYAQSNWLVILLFSMGYFGQQSWSTLIMVLPADLFPKRAVGTVAGLVGLGGALGGIVLGQLSGYLLDNGFDYKPVMLIAGLLHVTAFGILLLTVPSVQALNIPNEHGTLLHRAKETFKLALKVQIPAHLLMLLGLTVVFTIRRAVAATAPAAVAATLPGKEGLASYPLLIGAALATLLLFSILLVLSFRIGKIFSHAALALAVALLSLAAKIYLVSQAAHWEQALRFGTYCIILSAVADAILVWAAATYLLNRSSKTESPMNAEAVT